MIREWLYIVQLYTHAHTHTEQSSNTSVDGSSPSSDRKFWREKQWDGQLLIGWLIQEWLLSLALDLNCFTHCLTCCVSTIRNREISTKTTSDICHIHYWYKVMVGGDGCALVHYNRNRNREGIVLAWAFQMQCLPACWSENSFQMLSARVETKQNVEEMKIHSVVKRLSENSTLAQICMLICLGKWKNRCCSPKLTEKQTFNGREAQIWRYV